MRRTTGIRLGSASALMMCVATLAAPAGAAGQSPLDSIARLPGNAVERDTTSLLSPARLAPLPPARRQAWERYLDASRRAQARDRAVLEGELRALGRTAMTRAPYVGGSFLPRGGGSEMWLRSDSARRMADVVLSFQTPSGGWSKHVDMSGEPRQPGQSFYAENDQWQYIATIDNDATTSEMLFLARLDDVRPDARYRDAFVRGLDYLLDAQYPNGCWPQVYPLQGGYHDAVTFNDNAMVHVTTLLERAAGGDFAFVPASERARAAAAVTRAVSCLVASQVVVDGERTIWGQQHDPLTLAPTRGRSYELASLSAGESPGIVRFLMSLPDPDPEVIEAVDAAIRWFRAHEIDGYVYRPDDGLVPQAGAGPLWARMCEIGTDRPIFSNRDGIKLYDYDRLTDRRHGYSWYTNAPARVLDEYPAWAAAHPGAGR